MSGATYLFEKLIPLPPIDLRHETEGGAFETHSALWRCGERHKSFDINDETHLNLISPLAAVGYRYQFFAAYAA